MTATEPAPPLAAADVPPEAMPAPVSEPVPLVHVDPKDAQDRS